MPLPVLLMKKLMGLVGAAGGVLLQPASKATAVAARARGVNLRMVCLFRVVMGGSGLAR